MGPSERERKRASDSANVCADKFGAGLGSDVGVDVRKCHFYSCPDGVG